MSGNQLIVKYPLDWTGKNPVNLITGEPHTLGVSTNRAFVTNNGPFFVESVRVRSIQTGLELRRHDQFLVMQPEQEASKLYGKDIASVIYVVDQTVGTDILVDYQVLGGPYSYLTRSIRQLLESVNLDNRPVSWMDVIGKPSAFTPSPHLHDLGDTYGWEYIGSQLEGIAMAILMGDRGSHDELRQWFLYQLDLLRNSFQGIADSLADHVGDRDNPHQTTKAHVGLNLVENFGIASQQDAITGSRTDLYMTPLRTRQSAVAVLQPHLDDLGNPHQTTKAQVGLNLVENYQIASDAEARAGTRTDRYMTPQRTGQAIATLAIVPLNAHIANVDNPHGTTKAQVGLNLVENYQIATEAEARAGAATNRYMTPQRTGQAIATLALAPLNAHIANLNNPHSTTAAQVGAYDIAQVNALVAQRLSLAAGGTVLATTNFRKNGQTSVATAAVNILSDTGDAILSLHTVGSASVMVRQVRGTAGISVQNNDGTLVPVRASNIGTMADRDLFIGTAEPVASLGVAGDVYFRYDA